MKNMRIAGIIAEYNPFHNGHREQIRLLKEEYGFDAVVIVLSGDFLQRGEPAMTDTYSRTQMALFGGADLVVKMPVLFSTASAEYFAFCGVTLLSKLGVDTLCCGCETPKKEAFLQLADFLLKEPKEYKRLLKTFVKGGDSYPKAREKAVLACVENDSKIVEKAGFACKDDCLKIGEEAGFACKDDCSKIGEEAVRSCEFITRGQAFSYYEILHGANNLLALEYAKAIQKTKSSLSFLPIQRVDDGYHSKELGTKYASATAIRAALQRLTEQNNSANQQKVQDVLPQETWQLLQKTEPLKDIILINREIDELQKNPTLESTTDTATHAALGDVNLKPLLTLEDFYPLLQYHLLLQKKEGRPLDYYWDCTKELSNRIYKYADKAQNAEELCACLKTKNYTATRITRALCHILLDIKTPEKEMLTEKALFARVLGFSMAGASILRNAQKQGQIPLITKFAHGKKLKNEAAVKLFLQDAFAANLYRQVYFAKTGIFLPRGGDFPVQLRE